MLRPSTYLHCSRTRPATENKHHSCVTWPSCDHMSSCDTNSCHPQTNEALHSFYVGFRKTKDRNVLLWTQSPFTSGSYVQILYSMCYKHFYHADCYVQISRIRVLTKDSFFCLWCIYKIKRCIYMVFVLYQDRSPTSCHDHSHVVTTRTHQRHL